MQMEAARAGGDAQKYVITIVPLWPHDGSLGLYDSVD